MTIRLDSMKKVKEFVAIAEGCAGKIEVAEVLSKRYTVDGKSIMGILSLDLKNNLLMKMEDGKDSPSIIQAFESFIIL